MSEAQAGASTGTPPPERLVALEEERRFLLQSLRDLEREHAAGDLGDADHRALRDEYTTRAAAVLRQLEHGGEPAPAAGPPPRRRSWARVLGWTALVALVAVAAGLLVARSSGQRQPGQSGTGDISESVNTRLSRARQLQASDPGQAVEIYQDVLGEDPDNPEALTYLGWLTAANGASVPDESLRAAALQAGEGLLDRAIELAPDYADPSCFKAVVRFRFLVDAAGAKASIDRCQAADPPDAVAGLVQGLAADIEEALSSSTTAAVPPG